MAESPTKPKIFVLVTNKTPWGDVVSSALAEDGTVLAGHCSSSIGWARHDMGVHPDGWKHDDYVKHYPDGYEVVDLLEVDPDSDTDFLAAYARYREKKAATDATATRSSEVSNG